MKEYDCIIFTDGGITPFYLKPLGPYKVAHMLRQAGYSCLVIDHFHWFGNTEIVTLLKNAISDRTKFVGFSVSFFTANPDGFDLFESNVANNMKLGKFNPGISFCPQGPEFECLMVSTIKSINPRCKIVLGGSQTISDQISNRNIDYIVVGYAEDSAIRLMKHLEKNEPLQYIRNLYGINIVNDFEAKNYKFSECTMEWLPEDVFGHRVLPLEISRGCVFNCRFCQFPMRGKKSNDHVRLADHIYNELQRNYDQYGITTYSIIDDTFNDSDEKIEAFASAIKRLSFQPMFWCYARLDLFVTHPDRIKKLYDIGIRSMFLGVETLNRKAGIAVGKGLHPDKQIGALQSIRKMYGDDLLVHGSFIVGLPHEDFDSIDRTVNLIQTGEVPLHTTYFSALLIFKSSTWWTSDIDKNYQKYGYVEDLSQCESVIWKNMGLENQDPLPWRNEYTSFVDCITQVREINKLMHATQPIEGLDSFSLLNSDLYTWDQIKGMPYSKLKYELLLRNKRRNFIKYQNFINNLLTTT